jgi:HSP20 family molecular chaperone IbpA
MDVKQIIDFDRVSKHFDKLGEFVEGFFDDLEGIRTFGGDPEKAGIRVTKSKSGDGLTPIVIVEVEVPGCASNEVNVDVTAGRLAVRWTPKMTGKEQVRTFSLSKSADADGVSAVVKNGYLTVTIPGVSGKTPTRRVAVG